MITDEAKALLVNARGLALFRDNTPPPPYSAAVANLPLAREQCDVIKSRYKNMGPRQTMFWAYDTWQMLTAGLTFAFHRGRRTQAKTSRIRV